MPDDDVMRGPDSLAAALAALPLETPAEGGFARLAATLERRRRRAMVVRGFALAASLAAIALVPLALMRGGEVAAPPATPVAATPAATAGTPAEAQRAALIEQNEQLEAWVRAQDEPYDGASAYASAELEDLIGVIDAELSAN